MSAAVEAAPPPLSAYAQLPGISDVSVSPDGTMMAAILGDDNHAEVQIRNLADRTLITAAPAQRAKVRDVRWAGSGHLLLTTSTAYEVPGLDAAKREWTMLSDYDLAKRKWRGLLSGIENAMNVTSGSPTIYFDAGKPMVVVPGISFPDTMGVSTLYRVNLESGRAFRIELGNELTRDWLIGTDGKPIARADYVPKEGSWRLFSKASGNWQRIYTETAPIDTPDLYAFGQTANTALVVTHRSGDWAVHEVNLGDGSWSEAKPEFDSDAALFDPVSRRPIGTVDYGFESITYSFFNPADQKLWKGISAAFPGAIVTLESWSDDRQTIIVEVDGPKTGDAIYVIDRKRRTADFLADRYPGIPADAVNTVVPFRYKAADGLEIPAYLTLPPGIKDMAAARKLPLVVFPHGGPEDHDTPGFDWWAQAMASRGYAVLQPQFRGSTGFGAAHREAGFGEWGRKMQTDLSDGVRKLAADGQIDPARVCIVGASYGGYAALAGPTLDPGIYRCAAAVAGVSDLRRMLQSEISDQNGSRKNDTLRYWQRFMGAKSSDDPALDAISPARLAARVKVPVLLVHGKDDTVVRFDQSTTMERALRQAGAQVELVTLPGEDHYLSRPATRIAMLNAVVTFIEKHNPVATAAASAPAAPAR
ncbi:MAG: peptidase S9 [Alphaproteobacteria bacterium PA4]|nr:MAG: peptidase S9 [Alphaproteobacteria bacterium PA4]